MRWGLETGQGGTCGGDSKPVKVFPKQAHSVSRIWLWDNVFPHGYSGVCRTDVRVNGTSGTVGGTETIKQI